MNRNKLIPMIIACMKAGTALGFSKAQELNKEYMERSRGKGRGVNQACVRAHKRAMNTTYFPPSKRNGARECARRAKQFS